MTKLQSDVLYFVTFCVEQYKQSKDISGEKALEIFDYYGVTNFLQENYQPLHTQSHQWILNEIDTYIQNHKEK